MAEGKVVREQGKYPGQKIYKTDLFYSPQDQIPKFFKKHRRKLGKIVRIECRCDVRDRNKEGEEDIYPFRIRDYKGNEMWIHGATCGYVGGGPLTTLAIIARLERELLKPQSITMEMMKTVVHNCTVFVIEEKYFHEQEELKRLRREATEKLQARKMRKKGK